MRGDYDRTMLYIAAIWNWFAAAVVLVAAPMLRSSFGIVMPFDALGGQLFCMFVAIFGYGYWLVAREPDANHGIILLGVIGKFLVFGLFMAYAIGRRIQFAVALPTAIDALFAILFIEFLMRHRRSAADFA